MRRNLCDYSGTHGTRRTPRSPSRRIYAAPPYNNTGSVEAQTWNGTTVSARVVPDDTMCSASQETHSIKIRRQDPTAKLRSLCEVATFVSGGGARTSVRVPGAVERKQRALRSPERITL